jgi:hypothetical protein
MVRRNRVQRGLPPSGDDDLIAGRMEFMRQGRADARSAAGDENGVGLTLHGKAPFFWLPRLSSATLSFGKTAP